MAAGVLVAVGAVDLETVALSELSRAGVHVVRRCVDVADLVSVAGSRQASVALVSLHLRSLDADVVSRLDELELVVVGLCEEPDGTDRATLERLGVHVVLTPAELPAIEEVAARSRQATPPAADLAVSEARSRRPARTSGRGRVLAVWGPGGAPGRSVVALGIASEVSRLGSTALLVDADVYGGAQAQLLGLLDESSGLLAATRAANVGALDPGVLARHARQIGERLRVLTGLPRADRWIEVRPVLLRSVLEAARTLADATVVDCGFSLERDEEISYDTAAPRRNGATLEALSRADTVVVVGAADPVGLGRLIRALDELAEALPGVSPYVVVNRARASLGWSREEVAATVRRATGVVVRATLPDDPAACDKAMVNGRTLGECAPQGRLTRALSAMAADLVGAPAPAGGSLRRRTAARAR